MGVTPGGVRPMARFLRPLAWATLVANIGIVLTGGAVRLTGSGLGCPTWPRCTEDSYTPHGELDYHSAIEFGNRTLTFVLVAVAVATLVAGLASARRDVRWMVVVLFLGIPAQAVIGGITVRTDLNPWVVAFHLLVSLAIIGLAVRLLLSLDGPLPDPDRGWVTRLAWATFAAGWAVLYLGTVVTGSGPHAGDEDAVRNGLDPRSTSQLHTDLVFLFVGLTAGLLFALLATGGRSRATRAVEVLLGVEVAQGAIGFVQYATDLPVVLVGLHLLGAALISAVMTWALLEVRHPRTGRLPDVETAGRAHSPSRPT
ncbi:COX15/CtaA family protein [Nocardioides sp.]|uniref:COX15/CtaA family protein n=1 Tax=Nocardioides sp. TaxID=35761 RepID=UPI001A250E60|nr:COX15/CtaA family protein [Nocardioides sp.]MBJ7356899.1 heme A synthase [Nocardioides sp.]